MATRKRAIKRLYRRLKEFQELDIGLTAPGFLEIKFYLKFHSQCTRVLVEDDAQSSQALLLTPAHLPNFIQSQLQAQRVFADEFRSPVQVSAILQFAAEHLAPKPREVLSFPTLFCWYSPDTRRSYCIFAYLADKMASRIYTAAELLGLRDTQASDTVLDKVKKNPDLGDVIKARVNNTQPRRLKKAKEESTDSEEHVVFQGKKQAHLPIGNLDGDGARETEWKYRSRTESERTSDEPISAPTGLVAQQSEGFQRFFKAVVSPTHVRVTAGGRIVPNTRASASPTAKWDKERPTVESDSGDLAKQSSSDASTGLKGQTTTPYVVPMMMPHLASPMYPGGHPMFSPMGAPTPFFPMPNVGYGMLQTQPAMASLPQNQAPRGQDQSEAAPSTTTMENDQETKKVKPSPIKVSPPEQFDQTLPYFCNGSVFYPSMGPMPVQGQTTPMTPNAYFGGFIHPAIARVNSFTQSAPMPPMLSPHGFPSPAFAPSLGAGGSNAGHFYQPVSKTAPGPVASATKPPITSIKPSEITKSQLNSLRSQLRYYEDQMQYNKHQIDEKATQDQIHTIRKLIDQFEHNYQMQLTFESAYCSNSETRVVTIGSDVLHCQTPSRTSGGKEKSQDTSSLAGSAKSTSRSYPTLNHTQSMDQIRPKSVKDLRQRAGINSSKGNDTSGALDALEAHLQKTRSADPTKKSSLPTRAAMAPPFEPRGTPIPPSQAPSDVGDLTDAFQSSDTQWDASRLLPLSESGLWASVDPSGHFLAGGRLSSDTGYGPQSAGFGNFASPYLVGQLPPGVKPHAARATDYQYSRELTEEEKRARHIYWGQVPNKGLGLPKFDGKDFYPPSPVKAPEMFDAPPKLKVRQIPTGRPEVDYSFKLPKKSEDPFRISRDTESIRSDKSVVKLSHAVPIVNPDTLEREDVKTTPKAVNGASSQISANASPEGMRKPLQDNAQTSPTKTPASSVNDNKPASLNRRALDRSSRGSGNDLWQNMLRKGSTSGIAIPSAVSSTTATGYLPQYFGHAAVSLSPAVTNVNSPRTSSGGKVSEQDPITQQPQAQKMRENMPPSKEAEIIADLHQRMLRDAERRGVIGPGWQ
ncbi:hypothetical protein BJ170DRAFT_696434 [Xylariales sp. AK1849]|nr:hypothetical protein BJ170DRAFT_696434 [Xylariales sp. AK1849]